MARVINRIGTEAVIVARQSGLCVQNWRSVLHDGKSRLYGHIQNLKVYYSENFVVVYIRTMSSMFKRMDAGHVWWMSDDIFRTVVE